MSDTYTVKSQRDAKDCDGPMNYKALVQTGLTFDQAALIIGRATMSFATMSAKFDDDLNCMDYDFYTKTDEGYDKQNIMVWEEIESDRSENDEDDSVAGYDLVTGEPVYR